MFGKNKKKRASAGSKPPSGGESLTRDKVIAYLEGVLEEGGEEERWIRSRVESSAEERAFFESVREEIETQNLSISLVWRQERISCPHRDLLQAHHYGSLSEAESDFIRFHVERVGCAYCAANLDDIAAGEAPLQSGPMKDAKEELLRSTAAFLGRRSR